MKLLELLVVLIIIGILAALAFATFPSAIAKLDRVKANASMRDVWSQIWAQYAGREFPFDESRGVEPPGIAFREARRNRTDYEAWVVPGGICWYGVTDFGLDGRRQSPVHQLGATGDDLQMEIARLDCPNLPIGAIDD